MFGMQCLPNLGRLGGIVTVSYSAPMFGEFIMYYDGTNVSPKLDGAEGRLEWIESRLSSEMVPFAN